MNQLAALDHDSKHILDDAFVLGKRPLREGANLDQTARFRDQQWPLTPAVLQQHVEAMVLDFRIFPARYAVSVDIHIGSRGATNPMSGMSSSEASSTSVFACCTNASRSGCHPFAMTCS